MTLAMIVEYRSGRKYNNHLAFTLLSIRSFYFRPEYYIERHMAIMPYRALSSPYRRAISFFSARFFENGKGFQHLTEEAFSKISGQKRERERERERESLPRV